jgi:hypothetical protein
MSNERSQTTPERLYCMEVGSHVYEACVTIIAAARSCERLTVTRDEVEDFWTRVQRLEP